MFETQGPEAEVTEVRKVNAAEIRATSSQPPTALLLPFRIATRSAEVSSRGFADLLVLHRATGALMRCYNVIFADPRKRSATPPAHRQLGLMPRQALASAVSSMLRSSWPVRGSPLEAHDVFAGSAAAVEAHHVRTRRLRVEQANGLPPPCMATSAGRPPEWAHGHALEWSISGASAGDRVAVGRSA
jgi:hypothetical protein